MNKMAYRIGLVTLGAFTAYLLYKTLTLPDITDFMLGVLAGIGITVSAVNIYIYQRVIRQN